ncbi:MAG: GspE/PulE family protein [Patescibacteria group bacterium]
MVEFNEEKQNQRVDDLKKEEAENLTRMLAEKYGLPYLDLSVFPINIDALRILKEHEAREAGVAPFNVTDKKVQVGVLSPKNEKTIEMLAEIQKRGYLVTPNMVSPQSLEKVWARYKDLSYSFETQSGVFSISSENVTAFLKKVRTIDDISKLIQEGLSDKKIYRISKLLEIILAGALSTSASDIHLEPEEAYVRLRYRLDGVLTDVLQFDSETYNLLLSRIKLLSNLKLNIKGRAQDGRFSIKINDEEIEIRTSLLPGAYNDTIVLRILNPNAISVPLEELGIHPRLMKVIERQINKPNGMILNTGPTGSGKTTTLYAFLKKIHTSSIKIITIENPIEYHLPGIVQTQTQTAHDNNEGYTFAEGLRSALRQDPDVIMVGEIRDSETAETAINAALTGHLVFSTLHTNNAAGTFPRLIDLGVNPRVITSALSVAMAQRLVRKLCQKCKAEKPLTGGDKKIVDIILRDLPDKTYLEGVQTEHHWGPVGCSECHNTGYKGRIGIFEAIESNEKIEQVVEQSPSEREVKKAALDQNILSLQEDGIIKILQGTTSMEELSRVVDLPLV